MQRKLQRVLSTSCQLSRKVNEYEVGDTQCVPGLFWSSQLKDACQYALRVVFIQEQNC